MRTILLASLLVLASCVTSPQRGRTVGRPKIDRCEQQPRNLRARCERVRNDAVTFARRLSVDDQICLDGVERLEEPMGRCQVRAFVISTAPNGVKLEIRESPPDSRFTQGSEWWFAEEALAEVQLRAAGFPLPDDAP